jgi:hypothetical protein
MISNQYDFEDQPNLFGPVEGEKPPNHLVKGRKHYEKRTPLTFFGDCFIYLQTIVDHSV